MSEPQDLTRVEPEPKPAIHNHLKHDVTLLFEHAKELRDEAGRSERGRLLAIVATELEKVKAFIGYNGL